jgi:hypothetical protein
VIINLPDAPKGSARRPNVLARIVAGAAVVLAALIPIAALVFLLLHVLNALTFTYT